MGHLDDDALRQAAQDALDEDEAGDKNTPNGSIKSETTDSDSSSESVAGQKRLKKQKNKSSTKKHKSAT